MCFKCGYVVISGFDSVKNRVSFGVQCNWIQIQALPLAGKLLHLFPHLNNRVANEYLSVVVFEVK